MSPLFLIVVCWLDRLVKSEVLFLTLLSTGTVSSPILATLLGKLGDDIRSRPD